MPTTTREAPGICPVYSHRSIYRMETQLPPAERLVAQLYSADGVDSHLPEAKVKRMTWSEQSPQPEAPCVLRRSSRDSKIVERLRLGIGLRLRVWA